MQNKVIISKTSKLEEFLEEARNKTIFTVTITIIFAIILVVVGITPAFSSVAQQALENEARDEAIAKLEKKLTILKKATQKKTETEELYKLFNIVFPYEVKQEEILKLIRSKTLNREVLINSYSFSNDLPSKLFEGELEYSIDPRVKAQGLTLRGEGYFLDIVSFIEEMEKTGLILNVTNSLISRKSATEIQRSDNALRDYSFSITMHYYYFENKELK